MGKFLASIFSSKAEPVDFLYIAGGFAVFGFLVFAGYDLLVLHNPFNHITFSTSFGGIFASVAGSHRLRGSSDQPSPAP